MNNQTWYYQGNSWLDRARLWIDAYAPLANKTVALILWAAVLTTVGSFGFVIGEKSKAACPSPSRSVDVLSYRDPKTGVIVCELAVAKYYIPGPRDQ